MFKKTSVKRKVLAVPIVFTLAVSGISDGHANATVDHEQAYVLENEFPRNPTETDLSNIGVTRQDAEHASEEFVRIIREAQNSGKLTDAQSDYFLELAESPRSDVDGAVSTRALPLWAAGAIVGCAGSAVAGSGKTQIQNALKRGASVDEAADIAVDVAVDCVFGAIPGGAIAAAAKKTLTQPIKNALRPIVKKL